MNTRFIVFLPGLLFLALSNFAHASESLVSQSEINKVSGELGFIVQTLTPEIETNLGIKSKGIVISRVNPDSEASDKGLQRGDVITSINQVDIFAPESLPAMVSDARRNGRSAILVKRLRGTNSSFVVLSLLPRTAGRSNAIPRTNSVLSASSNQEAEEDDQAAPDPIATLLLETVNKAAVARARSQASSGYRQPSVAREDLAAPVLPGEPTQTFGYVANANSSYNQVCAGKALGVGSRQARICREWAGQAGAVAAQPPVATNSGSFYNQQPAGSANSPSGQSSSARVASAGADANQCPALRRQGNSNYVINTCSYPIEVAWCYNRNGCTRG
ncbi:MAG: PDZ domain-containing protein, partial [Microcystaceae cyanobacterium]